MGKVTDCLVNLIKKQIEERGIVVWYDPGSLYAPLLDSVQIPGADLFRYEDSFFRLRDKLEPYLEFINKEGVPRHDCEVPPRVLVYVPMERSAAKYALREMECAGALIEPGADSAERNTSLRIIAENVFSGIRPDKANEIGQKVEEGVYTLEDLDKLAECQIGERFATLAAIYETPNGDEIMLKFLADDGKDDVLQSKKAVQELRDLFGCDTGLAVRLTDEPAALRASARSLLLITELLGAVPADKRPGKYAALSIPSEPRHLIQVNKLCTLWRNRLDLGVAYRDAAIAVEKEMGVVGVDLDVAHLISNETFPSIEKRLLLHAEKLILDNQYDIPRDLAEKRKVTFWSIQNPTDGLRWSLLSLAAAVLMESRRIITELKTAQKDLAVLIDNYAGDRAWYRLDTAYRHFERQYTRFDLELGGEYDQLEKVVTKVRQEYTSAIQTCIEATTGLIGNNGNSQGRHTPQTKIFRTYVASALEEGGKIAYILMDSLRYEMGREAAQGLEDNFEVELFPSIGQLPTITPVGMAALLPGADEGLAVSASGDGGLRISIGAANLKDRSARVQHFKDATGIEPAVCKLKDLIKPSKKQKEEIQRAGCVIVTSQEIDIWGEGEEAGSEVREYMDEVIDKLRTGVIRLAGLGVTKIVIASDHGHIFGEAMESGMKMDPPGGETIELHRRVWIGRGGTAAPGYVRLTAKEIELDGDLEFAFPRSLSCFKAKGASMAYMHGGISLQEMVIPILLLTPKKIKPLEIKDAVVHMDVPAREITTRFFSITLRYSLEGFYGPDSLRVKVIVQSGKDEVGNVATAAYGFEESTGEIVLEKDKSNPVIVSLPKPEGLASVTVSVLDAASRSVIGSPQAIPVKVSI